MSATAAPQDGLPQPQRWQAMAGVLLAMALANLDTAIANTALPTIARDLGVTPEAAVWIVNSYQLGLVGTLLPLASLGESIGMRRIHLSGIAIVTIGSVLCALAWSLPSLIVARVLQSLGASAIMAANIALIRAIYPKSILGRAYGTNSLVVGASFAIGPTIASAILFTASWPWLFAVNVPIGIAAFVLARRTVPDTTRSHRPLDRIAVLLAASTTGLFVLGLDEAAHGAPLVRYACEWVVALLSGLMLLRHQAGHAAPILAVDLLRRPFFALSAVTATCAFATQGLAFVSLPFLLQHGLGYTQVQTGFVMTPWAILVALMAPVAGRLSDRYPPGILGGGGLAVLTIGMICLSFVQPSTSTSTIVLWMAVSGFGFGFFQSPNLRAFATAAPAHRTGSAGGIVALARLTGQSMGAALVATCFVVATDIAPWLALKIGAGFALVGCLASFARLVPRVDRSLA
jgi:DHA2 family multidrug resistance protein-like MFS transporter